MFAPDTFLVFAGYPLGDSSEIGLKQPVVNWWRKRLYPFS